MKVLFINISDIIGGAAIAATRLGDGLKKYHATENYFVVRTKGSDKDNVFPTRRNSFEQNAERWFNIFSNLSGLQYQYLPFSPSVIRQKIKEIKPDIISMHNTLGGYFPIPMYEEISSYAPVVWTLHDMWAFTGNAAHTFGDESWNEMKNSKQNTKIYPAIGINTGSWLLKQKKEVYSRSNITIVTPSMWLYSLAKQSPVFEGKQLHHIFNGVDQDVFYPLDKAGARKELNIPQDAKVLMFSAEKLKGNPYKGGRDLIEILRKINSRVQEKIHLLILGMGELEELKSLEKFVIHQAGYIKEEKKMAQCLSASDIFVYPTRADNLSNALVEAISCGRPAVTFDVGGCGEIITDNISGRLIKPFDLDDFALKTVELLSDSSRLSLLSAGARIYAEKNFSLKKMSYKYYELFKQLI
ncbi:MAG: glycosyltransferase [Syntrophothermus sp.]